MEPACDLAARDDIAYGGRRRLFRINPIRFAADKGIADSEAIDLFLHGTLVGLFEMDWLLLCPMCSDVVESLRSLRSSIATIIVPYANATTRRCSTTTSR